MREIALEVLWLVKCRNILTTLGMDFVIMTVI